MRDTDWNGRAIEMARSAGGVFACRSPWDAVIRGDVAPWPPPELVQKLYQSNHARSYLNEHLITATEAFGYYTDLQSVHSEDAVTWCLFGPLAYATRAIRQAYVTELLDELGVMDCVGDQAANLWLWRRIPHPDTLVPGGPEIDFGIQTARTLILGEAKWRSGIGAAQGAGGDKDQIQLRVEFCEKLGRKLYPGVERFVVLFVGQSAAGLTGAQRAMSTELVAVREATWEQVGGLSSNPWREEFLAQLRWRAARSHPT